MHEFNFPNCKTICASVTDIDGAEIRRRAGLGKKEIAVVFGGAPCQGFSLMGKRAMDDPRNALVYHFVRLVLELQPKYFVFENVKGLTVGEHKLFLREIIEAFEEGGYQVERQYRVLNAADYGVPQDRRRLFLIGAKPGARLPVYPEPQKRVTVLEAIGDLPEAEDFPELIEHDSIKAKFGKPSAYAQRLRRAGNKAYDYSYPRTFDRGMLTSSLLTDHSPVSRSRFAETAFGDTEPVSRFYKLDPDGVCNTLRAGTASDRGAFTSPRPIHPFSPRCITVREAARLHSYPDWFRLHVTKWHGMRQIGNSVPPILAQAVAGELIKVLKVKPEIPTEEIKLGDENLLSMKMTDAAAHFGVASNVIGQRTRRPAAMETVNV